MLLPALSFAPQDTDVKKVLMSVYAQLGGEGKKAMKEYLSRCGFTKGSAGFDVFAKVFKDNQDKDKDKDKGKEKRQRI